MDIVHHALIGGAGFAVASAHDQEIAGIAFIAGSVLPDLDVIFMLFGKRAYLKNHQGMTHSLLLSPLFALLIAWPLFQLVETDAVYWLAALFGIWLHILLDLMNSFRIALLYPSKRRYSLDAVFFIDAVTLLMTASFYAAWQFDSAPQAAYPYATAFAAYFMSKYLLHRHVLSKSGAKLAIPSSLNPFGFFLLHEKGDTLRTSYLNLLNGKSSQHREWPAAPAHIQALAMTSPLFCDMQSITRAFRVTEYLENDAGTTIHAADLGVRNYGGRFGRTQLRFDPQGRLIDEMANI